MSVLRPPAFVAILAGLLFGCMKEEPSVMPEPASVVPTASLSSSPGLLPQARYAGADYSQSIPLDEANKLINSYLTSVNYPAQDTALRSLMFDADTLRAYLRDTSIVTIRFFVAHTPSYANNSTTYGKYAGLKPDAMTLVIAGMNSSNQYVRSSRNGFYEHAKPCPALCPEGVGALLQ